MAKEHITIIGAGPAGLTAAIEFRKHGLPVRVFDKASDVGHRMHGDFQGLENWSSEQDITDLLKETGLGINFTCVPYYGGTVYAPEMKPVEVSSDRPIFYLVKRGPLPGTIDSGLKEQALSLGVELHFDRRLESIDGNAIVGTGPARAVGLTRGITFDTSHEDMVAVIFNDNIAPKGYAYLMINQGRGTMVTVLYGEFRRIEYYLDRTVHFFKRHVAVDMEDKKAFGGYGDFFIGETQVKNGKLYAGEAGGFQDYLWGFGMRYAILSGYLAAMSIIRGIDYDDLWKRELKPMMETSLVNRYLYEKFGHAGYRHIARRTAQGNPCGFLKKNYNPSLVKNLLLPLAIRSFRRNVERRTFSFEHEARKGKQAYL